MEEEEKREREGKADEGFVILDVLLDGSTLADEVPVAVRVVDARYGRPELA
jgi:hypothetical protein